MICFSFAKEAKVCSFAAAKEPKTPGGFDSPGPLKRPLRGVGQASGVVVRCTAAEARKRLKVFARLSRALWVFKRRRGFGAEPRTALRTHEICGFWQAKRRRKPHSSAVLFRSEPLREPEKNILFFARKFWAGGKAQRALGEPFFKKGLPLQLS